MKTLRQLIESKNKLPVAVSPLESVHRALEVLAMHDIGAVLVLDGERLVGIFSERDYARKVILQGKSSKQTTVAEVMTERVIYVPANATIEECMAIMTEKRIRHLPVIDDSGNLLGVVSIGDVVKETISQQQFIIGELERYITG
ncbi:CBS domain-containing protein [Propionivibrio limicola]|uniref:CBS domain-containing protein n=1 Tax=Propionivibrio limicola TaxID=167645 RepID=UPI0012910ED4|nr:CBS domain-containing protein [Propionivibrio limicola]